jgi:30S ribosomal protein S31
LPVPWKKENKTIKPTAMGKGDKKSRRGKIIIGTYGVRRPKNKLHTSESKSGITVKNPILKEKKPEKPEKPEKQKKEVKEKKETKVKKEIIEPKEIKEEIKAKPARKKKTGE